MAKPLKGRGGAGRGQGRKSTGVETIPVAIRLSTEQRDKLERLGGAPWVRSKIDKAKEPSRE